MNAIVQQEATGLAVERIFQILTNLADHKQTMTLTQIATDLDLPKSSVLKLLRGLVRLGYLSEDPQSKTYFPTLRICHLGHAIETALIGRGDYVPLLEELRDVTGESVGIAGQNGVNVQFYKALPGRQEITVNLGEGVTSPICVAAGGRVLLSQKPAKDVRKLVAKINATNPEDKEPIDVDLLLNDLRKVREQGYATTDPRANAQVLGLAKRLPVPEGMRPLVISIAGPWQRIEDNKEELVGHMNQMISKYFH